MTKRILWVVELWSEEHGWEPWFSMATTRAEARRIARVYGSGYRVRVRRYIGED